MLIYVKNHYNTVISLQIIKINEKNKNKKIKCKSNPSLPCLRSFNGSPKPVGWGLNSLQYDTVSVNIPALPTFPTSSHFSSPHILHSTLTKIPFPLLRLSIPPPVHAAQNDLHLNFLPRVLNSPGGKSVISSWMASLVLPHSGCGGYSFSLPWR